MGEILAGPLERECRDPDWPFSASFKLRRGFFVVSGQKRPNLTGSLSYNDLENNGLHQRKGEVLACR